MGRFLCSPASTGWGRRTATATARPARGGVAGMNEKQRAVRILANLEGAKEDLLALMDDVGHSINYRDAASRQAANQFLDAYGKKLDDFERLAGEIADLIRG